MTKKKKFIMSFSIAIFLMMISITNVKAKIPDIPTEKYGNYYVIVHTVNPDPNYGNDSYIIDRNDYCIFFFPSNVAYANFLESYKTDYNPFGITELTSLKSGASSPRMKAVLYANDGDSEWTFVASNYYYSGYFYKDHLPEIYYTSVPIKDRSGTTTYYEAGYMSDNYIKDQVSIKITSSNVCDKDGKDAELIRIDYNDFFNANYKYQYSYNNYDWTDVTESFTVLNGTCNPDEEICDLTYEFLVYYNTKLYARILDNEGNIIAFADYQINNSNLTTMYYIRVHTNEPNFPDFGVFCNDNETLYAALYVYIDAFNENTEHYILGYYSDPEYTDELDSLHVNPVKDQDIYFKLSGALPTYQPILSYSNKHYQLTIKWTSWIEESSDFMIHYNSSVTNTNYTYNYEKYLNNPEYPTFAVDQNDVITLSYRLNEEIVVTKTFNVADLITLEENKEIKYEHDIDNGIYSNTSFLDLIIKPIESIREILEYFFNSLNIYIKGFLISIFITFILCTIVNIIRR